MLGSWVCWQLLLGWAVLLSQPVFGDSDTAEEPSLQELEELVPVLQEAEEPVPVSQGPEEPVPVSEELEKPLPEPEEPVPVSEELEEPLPEPEEPVPVSEELEEPVLEKPEESEPISDEKLEDEEREEREWLKEDLSRPWSYQIHRLQGSALYHHHKYSEEYYRPFENANLRIQKAIGTTIYLRMIVVKTNCTNDQRPKEEESDAGYYYRLYHSDRHPRNCEPLSDSEQQDCRFTFFEDARNPGEPIVTDLRCHSFNGTSGRQIYDFPYELLEDM